MTLAEVRLALVDVMIKKGVPILYGGDLTIDSVLKGVDVGTYRDSANIDGSLIGNADFILLHRAIDDSLVEAGLDMASSLDLDVSKSYTYDVFDDEGSKVFDIKLRLAVPLFGDDYELPNMVQCTCITREFLIADRISILSGDDISAITDAMYDLYRLSFIENEYTTEALSVATRLSLLKYGDFIKFSDGGVAAIAAKYMMLSNIVNKPRFDVVYSRVRDFVSPFISGDCSTKLWSGTAWV